MGSWSTSITGNDSAQDLKYEYTAAFYAYDVPEALEKLEAFARAEIDQNEENEWCNYVYSLADFMWRKGILTDAVKQRALDMIDTGFGLDIWEEQGKSALNARKKALQKFRDKITSPQPAKKKIRPDAYLNPIFENGDLIALRLQTAGKEYLSFMTKSMSEEEFHSFDGKYILIQKIEDHISWKSEVVPEIKDHWAVFRLFDGVYDEIPEQVDIRSLKDAVVFDINQMNVCISSLFICESSMVNFKRRQCRVLGNFREEGLPYRGKASNSTKHIFMSHHPDSAFLSFMGWEIKCGIYSGDLAELRHIFQRSCFNGIALDLINDPYSVIRALEKAGAPQEAIEKFRAKLQKKQAIREKAAGLFARVEETFACGGVFYEIRLQETMGIISLLDGRLDHLYIINKCQKLGLGTKLLQYVLNNNPGKLYMDVPKECPHLIRMCKKAGMKKSTGAGRNSVRMIRK